MPLVLPKFHSAAQYQKYTFSSECTVRPITWGRKPVLTMREHRGRARCVTKGARRVRRGASGNLRGLYLGGAGCQLSARWEFAIEK